MARIQKATQRSRSVRPRTADQFEAEEVEEPEGGWEPLHKALLCTLGPGSLDPDTIGQLEAAGVTSFRINMSHTEMRDLERVIRWIQQATEVPIFSTPKGRRSARGP